MNAKLARELTEGATLSDQYGRLATVIAPAKPDYVLLRWEDDKSLNARHVEFFGPNAPGYKPNRSDWDNRVISIDPQY